MDAVRDHLLDDRRDWVERVLACADAVTAGWNGEWVAERERVVGPFQDVLERSAALDAAPAVLTECVRVAGGRLGAPPVAAPPYVVVTSRGPVLRATLADGRLVVRVDVFEVARTPTRYRRGATTPDEAVTVSWR